MERCAAVRGVCAGLVLAGSACGFSVSGSAPADGAIDVAADAATDAAIDAADDAAIDAPIDSPPAIPFCDLADSTLIGCWELEGTANNASAVSLSVTANNLTFVTGKVGMAGRFTSSTSVTVAESTALATSSFTIEAWVRVPALPAVGARMGVLDNDGEYGLFVHDAMIVCTGVQANVTLAVDTWTHLACTLDAATTTGRLYVDGTERATATVTVGLPGAPDLVIGDNSGGGAASDLIGDLDQLRLFGAARTPAQICEAAGKTSCP